MNYNKKTVLDVDVSGKKVLLRCDFNVPQDKETGEITSDKRIVAALPTIRYLLDHGAAVFYATVILLNKSIHQVEGIHRTFLQFLSAIVVLIPYVLSTNGITLSSLNAVGWVNLLIVGLVHTGITYCLYFSSLKELPGQEAAILSYIDPLVAVLVSVTLLGESMTAMQVIGGALILGFTLLNELSPVPKAKKE